MSYNTINLSKIHVMHWNAQGITTFSTIAELELFIRKNKIDIILLNETFLKSNHKFSISGFKIYRNDRQMPGGGLLIAIKNCIKHKLLNSDKTSLIENLSISVQLNGRSILITSAYSPKYSNQFKTDINILTSKPNDFFIFGDLNVQHMTWNCSSSNAAGNALYNHQNQSNYYVYHSQNHTRFSQTTLRSSPSTIDILLSNYSLPFTNLETHPNVLSSDHVPITCYINGNTEDVSHKIPHYHLANWSEIKRMVKHEISANNLLSAQITK